MRRGAEKYIHYDHDGPNDEHDDEEEDVEEVSKGTRHLKTCFVREVNQTITNKNLN